MADNGKQATWGGRFKDGPDGLMLAFGESVSFDQRLAPYDLQGSLGHASMLLSVGLLNQEEFNSIEKGLKELAEEVKTGDFEWKIEWEDVHMNLEQALRTKTDAADKLHTGRSRNDQVATDMRLFFKDACSQLRDGIEHAMSALLTLAKKYATTPIPGYTHLQRAQPVTVGHHLLAYVEMLGGITNVFPPFPIMQMFAHWGRVRLLDLRFLLTGFMLLRHLALLMKRARHA